MTRMLRALTGLIGAAAWLAVSATTAFAGDGYAAGGGGVKGESAGAGAGGVSLPFTGADLAVYVVIATAIVVSGLSLRAYSERHVDRN